MLSVNDIPADARLLTAAGASEKEPGLWHDLARRWLGAHQPDRSAAPDKAGVPA